MTSELLTPDIKSFVENYVAPKIEKFADEQGIPCKSLSIPKGKHIGEYLSRTYEKYSIINTMVFHNSQRKLKDIYVTQTLVEGNRYHDDAAATIIDAYPRKLIEKYRKILITDTAGMGKSTITKRMFIDLIDNCLDCIGIPIYIELNKLNKDNKILQEIQKELNSLSEKFDNHLLLKFIQTGGFIFFLDGYDEISIADRDVITQDIQTFISQTGSGNFFILTSRLESGFTSFGDFRLFRIRPLKKEEAYELLKKYDSDKGKELSGKLVELLESGQYDSINEFLVNPLLVSLLFTAYDFNRSIPFEKHRFYGVVFEAYFEKHDNTKAMKKREKRSGLNYDGFDRLLRYIGYDCLVKTGVKFNKDAILNTIRKAKVFCGISDFSENSFLEDLVTTVPLFCKEGTDYKWVHKSLLEYFAARFIFCDAKENQDKILTAIYDSENSDNYFNMLEIYYDIDIKGFSKNITLPFCEKFIKFYEDNIFSSSIIRKDFINDRISKLFIFNFAFLAMKGESLLSSREVRKFFDQAGMESDYSIDYYRTLDSKHKYLYIAENDKENLTLLLFRKNNSIFVKAAIKPRRRFELNVPEEFGIFYDDKCHNVDLRTGDNNELTYMFINSMTRGFRYHSLDYIACKKEVVRIKKEIAQSEDLSNLLPR